MANSIKLKLNNLLTSYKKWIELHPQILSEIETTIKCLSYFGIGQFGNSSLGVELISSMSSLIVLYNDLLIYNNKREHLKISHFESKIKIWLTVVEYVETLFEMSSQKLWGMKGKWLTIVIIQLFKTALRLLLLFKYKERLVKNPATAPLNREKFNKIVDSTQKGFKLKSGLVIRSLKHSLPLEVRSWEALPCNDIYETENLTNNQEIDITSKLAESIYVLKPLLHLGCMYITNQKHWPPWILSFVIDIVSLNVLTRYAKKALFTKEEKEELIQRRLCMLLYLLKSPFYEKFSRTKIQAILDMISGNVPFANLLADAVKKNLPYMEDAYFYLWSR